MSSRDVTIVVTALSYRSRSCFS